MDTSIGLRSLLCLKMYGVFPDIFPWVVRRLGVVCSCLPGILAKAVPTLSSAYMVKARQVWLDGFGGKISSLLLGVPAGVM